MGAGSETAGEVADELGGLGTRVLLALDNCEVFRLMDTWLRQAFVPTLAANVRVLLAGREPPLPAWFASAEWNGLFASVALGPLEPHHALELLEECGVGADAAAAINRMARGHPLALKLASTALTERPDLGLQEAATQRVVEEFTRLFYADIPCPTPTPRSTASPTTPRCSTSALPQSTAGWPSSSQKNSAWRTTSWFDNEAGELRLHGQRIGLTPLELGVVDLLRRQEGRVVSRRVLLQEVWGSDYCGGSNLVDSVVRSLRRKLGDQAPAIETVRGYGYRFRRP